jgi:hypothetical protein
MIDDDEFRSARRFARVACVVGGVFDGLTLFPMIFPSLGGKMFGLQAFAPGADYRYAMNVGASLMLGWTLLLFWAAWRPIERAGVLLLTAVVVFGLMLAGAGAVFSGLVLLRNMLPIFVLQFCVLSLFLIGYLKVSRLSPGSRAE